MGRFKSFKCRMCDEWICVPVETIDYVHQCIKANKQRMTADDEFEKIPERINLKIDAPNWNVLGQNIRTPDKKRPKADIVDSLYEDIEVDTMNELD